MPAELAVGVDDAGVKLLATRSSKSGDAGTGSVRDRGRHCSWLGSSTVRNVFLTRSRLTQASCSWTGSSGAVTPAKLSCSCCCCCCRHCCWCCGIEFAPPPPLASAPSWPPRAATGRPPRSRNARSRASIPPAVAGCGGDSAADLGSPWPPSGPRLPGVKRVMAGPTGSSPPSVSKIVGMGSVRDLGRSVLPEDSTKVRKVFLTRNRGTRGSKPSCSSTKEGSRSAGSPCSAIFTSRLSVPNGL
mmetsp:Transcript_98007/g.292815  ORF Transcript_98007/g.292815 Transcript_98007/m.292815 type:complete len:244 (-) Transcript_98007:29-760(-)